MLSPPLSLVSNPQRIATNSKTT